MNKGERITLIERCAAALDEMTRDAENLRLATFGIGERAEDQWGQELSTMSWLAQQADDQQLIELAQHLGVLSNEPVDLSGGTSSGARPGVPEALFIFASHLSTQRRFLGEVADHLKSYEVGMFVAHDSIPMDAPWSKEIVDALNSCHAGAAFLHPGFHESFYCQQECGWMLGRGIPLARLMLGESPKALLGELQGGQLSGKSAPEVAVFILDWALSKSSLHVHVAESLTMALKHSTSFRHTDRIWERLRGIETLAPDQLRRVIFAAEFNGQVYGANVGGWSGEAYQTAIARRAKAWDTEGLFEARIARLADPSKGGQLDAPEDEITQYMTELRDGA